MGLMINGIKPAGLVYNGKIIHEEEFKPDIKSFSEASDEEIAKYLDWHYKGKINISKYWHVGDTRLIHIDETNSGTKDHVAQDMTIVIYGFNHDDLSTPINGTNKAAVSVGFREVFGNAGNNEYEYYWGNLQEPVADTENYSASPLRTWLNDGLLNALPVTFSPLIKEVNKKNLQYHSKADGAPLITKDKIWLLSYPEVFGTIAYNYYLNNANPSNFEGEQYEYMKTSTNRIKKINNNGTASLDTIYYWLRSPSSGFHSRYGYFWCILGPDGVTYTSNGSVTRGLAPAFCL